MANFAALQSEVLSLLIDAPSAVTALTPTWVNRAIRKLQVKHDYKDMEKTVSYATVAGVRSLAGRPTDWKKPRNKPYIQNFLGNTSDIQFVSSEAEAATRWGNNTSFDYGRPQGLTENVATTAFWVWPYPDGLSDAANGEYTIVVPYWGFLPVLALPADTNWFTDNAEQWIVYTAVAEGFYTNEDETRAQLWDTRALKEYKDVVTLDKTRRIAETIEFVPHLGARRPHTQE